MLTLMCHIVKNIMRIAEILFISKDPTASFPLPSYLLFSALGKQNFKIWKIEHHDLSDPKTYRNNKKENLDDIIELNTKHISPLSMYHTKTAREIFALLKQEYIEFIMLIISTSCQMKTTCYVV